jgi:hypothetical protein
VFKSVEYTGFENRPELRATAERLTPVLANEIRRWRDQVSVEWRPGPPDAGTGLDLSLALALWNTSGSATGLVPPETLAHGRDGEIRSDMRGVWLDLLAQLSQQQMERLEEMDREPVET